MKLRTSRPHRPRLRLRQLTRPTGHRYGHSCGNGTSLKRSAPISPSRRANSLKFEPPRFALRPTDRVWIKDWCGRGEAACRSASVPCESKAAKPDTRCSGSSPKYRMINDQERECLHAEHQRFLDRMRMAIRERLTSRGRPEAEIEQYLATLPAEPISTMIQRVRARVRRGDEGLV